MKALHPDLKRILLFLSITFGLTWGYCLLVIYPLADGAALNGVPTVELQLLTAAAMFIPALGVLLTRLITRDGFSDHWLKPHFKGNLRIYLLAWFGPVVLTLLGTGLYFLLFPDHFDPTLGYMRKIMEASGVTADDIPMPLDILMPVTAVQAIFLAPVLNFVTCFGEEWGCVVIYYPKCPSCFPLCPCCWSPV